MDNASSASYISISELDDRICSMVGCMSEATESVQLNNDDLRYFIEEDKITLELCKSCSEDFREDDAR